MKFKRETLQALLWGEDVGLTVISNDLTDTSRWSLHYDLVFKEEDTGKFYSVSYSRGATESQDEQPFEYDGDEIGCVEVQPVEKVVTVYEPAK